MRGPLEYYRELAFHGDRITHYFSEAGPVTVPTLVLWGGLDSKMMPEMAAMSCAHVSAHCEHEVFEASGHYLQWELPDEVVVRWRRFVRR
jgi:pimeloyl-ACP methyl ester carboxylesterase